MRAGWVRLGLVEVMLGLVEVRLGLVEVRLGQVEFGQVRFSRRNPPKGVNRRQTTQARAHMKIK